MIERLADLLFALEAIEEDGIAFHFGVGDFDGDGAAGAKVGGAKDGGHAAAGDDAVDAVMIELIAGVDGNPRQRRSEAESTRRSPDLTKLVRPPAVHAHAFDAANANQLNADIITAVPLVGNIHQLAAPPASNRRRVPATRGHLRRRHGAVQPVGAQQQDIAGETPGVR